MLSRTGGERPIANAIAKVMLEWKSRWVSGKFRKDEREGGHLIIEQQNSEPGGKRSLAV